MGIDTSNPGFDSPEAYTAGHRGQSPQDYFSQVVRDDADARDLPEAERELAAAQAAVAAFGDQDAVNAGPTEGIQALAQAVNHAAYWVQVVGLLKAHQKVALAVLAGKIPDYQPYLSTEGQILYRAGWIDTTAVPA